MTMIFDSFSQEAGPLGCAIQRSAVHLHTQLYSCIMPNQYGEVTLKSYYNNLDYCNN